jgi:CRP-like cAMP-binding protein
VRVKTTAFVANGRLIEALEKRSQPVTSGDDCILFRQGETPRGVYILRSGEATLTMKSSSGETLLRMRATAGSLLGLPGVIGREPYTLSATVRRGSVVNFVSRNDFDELIRAEPGLSLGVCEVLAAEVRSARQAISDL